MITHVVDKFLTEMQSQLDENRVMLYVDEPAKLWLAERGYDEKMGARPMARLIQESLKKPLAEQILFGELSEGGAVHVSVANSELSFDYEPAQAEDSADGYDGEMESAAWMRLFT